MDEEIERALDLISHKIGRAKLLVAVTTLVAIVAGVLTMIDQHIKRELVDEALALRADLAGARAPRARAAASKPPAAEGA